ncbi:hypothetical protein BDZ97DRAFT_1919523 [Flammula alnicola]|nr:hypothetical protein BDZ97DRAFT_1919523 [Flammula alnicola]
MTGYGKNLGLLMVFYPADSHNKQDPKTAFNSWIVEVVVPPLYLSSLEHLICPTNETAQSPLQIKSRRWWLLDHCDEISQLAQEALFHRIPDADNKIFQAADGQWLSFEDSVFSKHEPLSITNFLVAIRSPRFVTMHRHTAIAELPSAKTADARFVKDRLTHQTCVSLEQVRGRLPRYSKTTDWAETIFNILDYICDEASLVGLPLLFLASGTLISIPGLNDTPVYYTRDMSHARLFPNANFLKLGYSEKVLARLQNDININVLTLTEGRVMTLVSSKLGQALGDPERRRWVMMFWEVYTTLPGPPSIPSLERAGFEIIRGMSRYMALHECVPHQVVYGGNLSRSEAFLSPLFQKLNIEVLKRGDNPIIEEFLSKRFPDLLKNVLHCMESKGISDFNGLTENEREELSQWFRTAISRSLHGLRDVINTAFLLQLPIWETHTRNAQELRSASTLWVLPSHFAVTNLLTYLKPGIAVASGSRMLVDFMGFCKSMSGIRQDMTFQNIMAIVQLPTKIDRHSDIRTFKNFTRSMLNFPAIETPRASFSIPDEDGNLRHVHELYDYSVPLFSKTLQYTEQSSFVHADFRDLTQSLRDRGLIHETTLKTFSFCVGVLERILEGHTHTGEPDLLSLLEISQVAFNVYQRILPRMIMTDAMSWEALDSISFFSCPVTTVTIYRPALEPIAWTQRSLFFEGPTQDVLTLNANLGVPKIAEVVEHLKILTTEIGRDHPRNLTLMSDIKATYKWLNDRADDAREILLFSGDLRLFLNVDDPVHDDWNGQWCSGQELVLNLGYDHGTLKYVRRFLQEYEKLLRAAGCIVLKVVPRQMQENMGSESSDSIRLRELRNTFNEMRKSGELTDFILQPTYNGTDDACVDASDLRGHRALVAAIIPHFRESVKGWKSGPNGEIAFYGSAVGAKTLLDFIYTGDFVLSTPPVPESDNLARLMRDLLELLPIADEWNMPDLKAKLEWNIVYKYDVIQKLPHEYQTMFDEAEKYNATILRDALEEFRRHNGIILQHYKARNRQTYLHRSLTNRYIAHGIYNICSIIVE